MQLQGTTWLISGGGSGLGAACAREFAGADAVVVIADLNTEAGEATAHEIGAGARFVHTDVTDEQSVRRAVTTAGEAPGVFRGAINCAGVAIAERALGRSGPHSLERFTRVVQVNLIGTFNLVRLAAEAISQSEPLADGERGAIVCTASVAAFDGQIGQVAYSASKGGVVGMTLPLAREFAQFGIRVMTIAPGIFDTPMLAGLPEPARLSLGQQVPFPSRLGHPAEYAALARHIAENSMLNGEVIRLDGAIRMAPR